MALSALIGASVPSRLSALLLAPTLAIGACRAPVSDAPAPALTDANIAALIVQANAAEMLYAEMALAKSQTPSVREFASMTNRDHASVNKAAIALVTRLGIIPVENTMSLDLRDDAEAKRRTLRDFEGFAFDSAYAANEIASHTTLLVAMDSSWIPAVRNAELRAILVAVRPAVAAHVTHAKALAGLLRRP